MEALPISSPISPEVSSLRARALAAKERPARYGPDLDLTQFGKPGIRAPVASLGSLDTPIREAALLAGVDTEETDRSASYFQIDYSAIYQGIQQAYQGQIELMTTQEALQRYEWLWDFWWKAVEVDSDKYTAKAELDQTGGFFLRVLAGQRVALPIQACLFVQENNVSQNVHNLIIVEEDAEAQLITGCTLNRGVEEGLHIGVTEVYLKAGATLANTMIHNWAESFHVRPRTGVIADARSTFVSNYILLRPVRSVQAFPKVVLQGERARAHFHNIIIGMSESVIDIGTKVELLGRGSQAESISRAVARDSSVIILRGEFISRDNESRGHLDCRGMLLSDAARIDAIPELQAIGVPKSELSHEAAVGPIAEEMVEYLMTRGLTHDDAVATLVLGFLKIELPGLPAVVTRHLEQLLAETAGRSL
jgi:Fe-S cluster assembly scaffold protein SufB